MSDSQVLQEGTKVTVTTGKPVTVFSSMTTAAEQIACLHPIIERDRAERDKFLDETATLTVRLGTVERERDRFRLEAETMEVILAAVFKDRDELREALFSIGACSSHAHAARICAVALTKSKDEEEQYGKTACPVCEDPGPHEHVTDPAKKPQEQEQSGTI